MKTAHYSQAMNLLNKADPSRTLFCFTQQTNLLQLFMTHRVSDELSQMFWIESKATLSGVQA